MPDCFSLPNAEDFSRGSEECAESFAAFQTSIDAIKASLAALSDDFSELCHALCEAWRAAMTEITGPIWDDIKAVLIANADQYGVPAAWIWHYRHAKKRRIRKKYEDRIWREICRVLLEEADEDD